MKARDLILAASAETGHPVKPRSGEKERWENSEGQLHRYDGPAVEYTDGFRVWYQNDQRHRDDGPAVEHADGYREWWQSDRLIARNDQPDYQAVLAANGFPPDIP